MRYIGSVVNSQLLPSCGADPVDSRVALKQSVWLGEESFPAWVHVNSACNACDVFAAFSLAKEAPMPQKAMMNEIVRGNQVMMTLQDGRIS